MPALDDTLSEALDAITSQYRFRRRVVSTPEQGVCMLRDGKRYLNFSSNDYFGLSQHPDVLAAAQAARAGAGSSALVTGYHQELAALEAALAKAKGTAAALVFGSGYLANLGTISALVGKGDLILADKAAHACMLDGAQLSGATLRRFRHNDMTHLSQLLAQRDAYRHCLILTETVFSMDGDLAPLGELAALAAAHDAWLLTDDAHGLGLPDCYPRESGDLLREALKIPACAGMTSHVHIGTLSKGLGAYGGYVAGSQTLIDYLVNTARPYIFTTALPPSVCAAARAALEVLMQDEALRAAPLARARQFTDALGLPEAQSPIVPLIIGEDEAALAASQALAEAGFWVSAIRPPTVPPGTARLRLAFSALHTREQVDELAHAKKYVIPNTAKPFGEAAEKSQDPSSSAFACGFGETRSG